MVIEDTQPEQREPMKNKKRTTSSLAIRAMFVLFILCSFSFVSHGLLVVCCVLLKLYRDKSKKEYETELDFKEKENILLKEATVGRLVSGVRGNCNRVRAHTSKKEQLVTVSTNPNVRILNFLFSFV